MGLFDGLEDSFVDVVEFGVGLPANTYEAMVSDVTTEQKDSGLYLVITYAVTDGPYKGKTHKEYQKMVVGRATTEKEQKSLQFIKTRLLSLGIPADRQNKVTADDIVGAEVAITIVPQKDKPQFNNIARVVLINHAGTSAPALPTSASVPSTSDAGTKVDPFA